MLKAEDLLYVDYIDNILNDIKLCDDGKKLRTYKIFKTDFRLEHYLLHLKSPKHRQAIAQFRLSSHNLGIETGRHCRPVKPVSERICKYCDSGEIDDEVHFLLKCNAHELLRADLIICAKESIEEFDTLTESERLAEIMKSSNKSLIESTANFVYKAFNERECRT